MSEQFENQLPGSREELLERIRQEWEALIALVNGMPPTLMEQSGTGGWTPKDNLAHIYEWEHFMLEHYLRGQGVAAAFNLEEGAFDGLNEDEENEVLYQRNRSRFPGDVIEMLRLTHDAVMKELQKIPWEYLLESHVPDEQIRLVYVLGNTADHYVEHRRNIEEAIKM